MSVINWELTHDMYPLHIFLPRSSVSGEDNRDICVMMISVTIYVIFQKHLNISC